MLKRGLVSTGKTGKLADTYIGCMYFKFQSHCYFREMWEHMTKMAAVLMHTSEVMNTQLSHSSYLAVKELMASPTWRYLHKQSERKHTTDPPKIIMTEWHDYKEHFEIAGMS